MNYEELSWWWYMLPEEGKGFFITLGIVLFAYLAYVVINKKLSLYKPKDHKGCFVEHLFYTILILVGGTWVLYCGIIAVMLLGTFMLLLLFFAPAIFICLILNKTSGRY